MSEDSTVENLLTCPMCRGTGKISEYNICGGCAKPIREIDKDFAEEYTYSNARNFHNHECAQKWINK